MTGTLTDLNRRARDIRSGIVGLQGHSCPGRGVAGNRVRTARPGLGSSCAVDVHAGRGARTACRCRAAASARHCACQLAPPAPQVGTAIAVAQPRATSSIPIVGGMQQTDRHRAVSLRTIVVSTWAVGAALLAAVGCLAVWRLRRIRRTGLPWLEARPLVDDLAARAGITRPVDLLVHEAIAAPLTCGSSDPRSSFRTRLVSGTTHALRRAFVHELEHVRRRDWWVHLAARVVCALYWFHPLVWIAYRQLTLEAERACDDAVVEREESTQYAEQLVSLRAGWARPVRSPSLAMASRSDLSARVTALLDAQAIARASRTRARDAGGCRRCRSVVDAGARSDGGREQRCGGRPAMRKNSDATACSPPRSCVGRSRRGRRCRRLSRAFWRAAPTSTRRWMVMAAR